MKKFFVLLAVMLLSLALLLSGCGATEPEPEAEPVAEAEEPAAEAEPEGLAAEAAAVNKDDYFITVLTGPSSGIYFPIGGAFATALDAYGYTTSATATGASGENINGILNDQGELAIAMSDSVIQAYEAYGAFEGQEPASDLRCMMSLWPNFVQIVTTTDSGITSFEDLKGKKVGVGAPNSGVEINARMIFEAHNMSYDDCQVDYLSYGEAIEQMKNGQCDVAFVTSGLGNATITELGVTKEIYIVPVEGDGLNNLIGKYPFFSQQTIPADVYGTAVDTTTAAVMNVMLVDKDLPDAVVYDLLTGVFDQLDTIHASHNTAAANILLEQSLRSIPIPLHPGAEAFFADRGVSAQ